MDQSRIPAKEIHPPDRQDTTRKIRYPMMMKATRCRELREDPKEEDPNNDENDDSSSPPKSYLSNTPKEAECLSLLATISKDPTVPQVGWLLSARNEYGTAKPLPTYLRPTLLPHPNLYDLKDLLQFVFRHVRHESWLVEDTTTTAISPNQTLKWRAGDSLDQSILLASLLLGAGYDAYVLVGTAPDWLCRGETDLLCIGNDDDDWRGGHGSTGGAGESCDRFGWRGMPFTEVPVDVDRESGNGSANGLHAWVMVRPGRRCDDGSSDDDDNDEDAFDARVSTIFADPAVGRIWSAEDDSSSTSSSSPYSSTHTIWNQSNQWIRLSSTASEVCAQIPSYMYIDLEDESIWRPIWGNEVHVPASWAEKIEVPVPFPSTEHRVELYAQAKLELSTASRKLTRYNDEERTEETEAIEVFQGRLDYLLERQSRTTSPNQTFTETFSEFHPAGLRQWTETLGVERIIDFHLWIRADGLVCRKENYGDEKISEEFRSRPDGLTQRIIRVARISEGDYAPKGASILNKSDGEEVAVMEIEEHCGDLDDIKAKLEADNVVTEQAVTSRIFHLVENRISVKRIYHDGVAMVSNTENIKKEQANVSQRALFGKDDAEDKEARGNNSTAEALISERESISAVLSIQEDMLHLCRVRCNEERKWLMQHDEAPISSIPSEVPKGVEEGSEAKPNTEQPRDYLEPFLIGVHDVNNIPPEEAERIKEACLDSLKDRLLQRAQIMQSKLDEEKKEVGMVEESRDSLDDEAASRIRVWEQRLEQHEARSLDKFVALQETLNSDERLQRAAA